MPTLAKLGSCVVLMYAADHPPPHFHIQDNDAREVLVAIDSLEVLRGKYQPRTMREGMEWAAAHPRKLKEKWRELNS